MTEYFIEYGLFFSKTITIFIFIFIILASLISLLLKNKSERPSQIKIKNLNKELKKNAALIQEETLTKHSFKEFNKNEKKQQKQKNKDDKSLQHKNRLFVINFMGDIKASACESLKNEITSIISVIKKNDEVLLCLESPGGMVHSYGLAASQLLRLKKQNIFMTVAVDKVAASGGYLMASTANKIIAAPFAIIGSIGVVAQLPNFNKWLKEKNIDYEQITAGEYKRTLTLFGENTDQGREKFKEEIEETHDLFKDFVIQNRNNLDLKKVATGEHWYGTKAKELNLIDDIMTSDDFLLEKSKTHEIFEISFSTKKGLLKKIGSSAKNQLSSLLIKTKTY